MARRTVVYDANVLYSSPLRRLLMYLAVRDLFNARGGDDIHDYWTRSVKKNRPDLNALTSAATSFQMSLTKRAGQAPVALRIRVGRLFD
jgi:hypothetical protein